MEARDPKSPLSNPKFTLKILGYLSPRDSFGIALKCSVQGGPKKVSGRECFAKLFDPVFLAAEDCPTISINVLNHY
jgi:hypothetical protein